MKSAFNWQWSRFTAVAALALLAVACGGGGGGDSGEAVTVTDPSSTTPVTTPPVSTTLPATPSLLDPTIISRAGEGGNAPPLVAIDSTGNALAVWRVEISSSLSPAGLSEELLARRYIAGSGWQAIVSIAGPTSGQSLKSATISMDKVTGKASVAWFLQGTVNAPNTNVFASNLLSRAFDPVSGWAAPLAIETSQPLRVDNNIALATDANGNAIVVWNRYESLQTRIYASRYTAGGAWSAAVRIEDDTSLTGGGSGMLVTFLPNGNALVVWNSSRGGTTSNIWGNQYTVGSGWGTNALVMSGSGAQTSGLIRLLGGVRGLAADQNGNAVLTFENQQLFSNPSRYELNLWSKRYSGGAWGADSTAVPVGVPLTCSNCPSLYGGSVQMNAQGAAVATWELRNASGGSVIWAARSRSDGTWDSQQLSTNLPGFRPGNEFPEAGIDDQGNVNVLWAYTNTDTNIYSARYTAGTGWAAPVLLENYSGTAERPRIAMNERGSAMTVWMQFENAVGSVVASRYFSSGR
jgi:hypothetical protein